MSQHCELTEPCVEDVYCNCGCIKCSEADCYRPGCKRTKGCAKVHVGDHRWYLRMGIRVDRSWDDE